MVQFAQFILTVHEIVLSKQGWKFLFVVGTKYISYTIINIRPKYRYLTSSQSSGIRARDRDMRHREWERRTEEDWRPSRMRHDEFGRLSKGLIAFKWLDGSVDIEILRISWLSVRNL